MLKSFQFPVQSIALLACGFLGVYFVFALGHRTVQIYHLRQEAAQIRLDIRTLREQYRLLIAERDRLHSTTDIERIAREQLNLIKPGETAVIVLPTREAVIRAQQAPEPPQQPPPPAWRSWWGWLFGP